MNYLPGTASLVEEIDSMFFVICITCNMFYVRVNCLNAQSGMPKSSLHKKMISWCQISVQSICHSFLSSQLHGVHKIRDINMLFMSVIKYLISGGGTDTLVEIVNVI